MYILYYLKKKKYKWTYGNISKKTGALFDFKLFAVYEASFAGELVILDCILLWLFLRVYSTAYVSDVYHIVSVFHCVGNIVFM